MEERQLNGPVSGHGGSEHSGSVLDEDDLHGLSFADCAELLALTPEEVSKSSPAFDNESASGSDSILAPDQDECPRANQRCHAAIGKSMKRDLGTALNEDAVSFVADALQKFIYKVVQPAWKETNKKPRKAKVLQEEDLEKSITSLKKITTSDEFNQFCQLPACLLKDP